MTLAFLAKISARISAKDSSDKTLCCSSNHLSNQPDQNSLTNTGEFGLMALKASISCSASHWKLIAISSLSTLPQSRVREGVSHVNSKVSIPPSLSCCLMKRRCSRSLRSGRSKQYFQITWDGLKTHSGQTHSPAGSKSMDLLFFPSV